MDRPTYKFTEFVDLLLVKLYDLDQTQGSDGFFDLDALAKQIKGDVPTGWVFDAAKVLDTRALADCMITFGGAHAKISGEGRLYVEEGRGITKSAQEAPDSYYVNVNGSDNQIVVGHSQSDIRQNGGAADESPVAKLVDEMAKRIEADSTLAPSAREEALTYTKLVLHEVKKPEPNRSLIAAVLEPLSKIASIAGSVASLIKLFNAAAY
jgi:hypothetical protein